MSKRCSPATARRRWRARPNRRTSSRPRSSEMDEFLPTAAAARLIASRKLSPVELTQHYLARIRSLDPILHSFILVTEERALSDARDAQARLMAGQARGPV